MVGDAVRTGLRREGFQVDWVRDGQAAETAAATEPFDLMLLDLGLPKKDGLAVLRALRAKKMSLPVLIVTARDAVAERIAGLDAGADDYVVKPFDLLELAARIRAVARRHQGRPEPVIRHRGLVLDPATREASFNGAPVTFLAKEFALLEALLSRPGAVLSRAQGGVVVESAGGPAAKAGIQAGDVILAINGTPVSGVAQLRELSAKAGKTVALLVQREDAKIFVPVELG